jgi:ribonuclease J
MDESGNLGFERCYHVSSHASGEDITWAIEQIDPDYIVPIHTEANEWFSQNFENVVLVEESERHNF